MSDAEPLTAEELERERGICLRFPDHADNAVIMRHLATIDARDAALGQAEEARDRLLAALWEIRMTAQRATVDEPPFVLPNNVIYLAEGAMGKDRRRAQELAFALREGR